MGQDLYRAYWQSILPQIIEQLRKGYQLIQLPVKELSNIRERQSYYTNFRIVNSSIEAPNNAQAYGRDLYAVLFSDNFIRENFADKSLQVTISGDLQLKIEVLSANSPDFFTEEDFEELCKFAGQRIDDNNKDHQETNVFLRKTYSKVEYWANEVKNKFYPLGAIKITRKPTNQANSFAHYQWAKIYPDKTSQQYKVLAFTVSIDTDYSFIIKIDTVGLPDGDERKEKYHEKRGEFSNSKIVKIFSYEQVLDKGWSYLIDLTGNIILSLKPDFDELLKLFNKSYTSDTLPNGINKTNMSLNTILYGPPGTGKTYYTIAKAVSIANPEFDTDNSTREQIRIEYERLQKEGQIEFITFHQSLSYEDFLEGIKPKSENNSIEYEIEDGIFKRISNRARYIAGNFETVIEKFKKDISRQDGKSPITIKASGTSFDITFRGTGVFYVQPHSSEREDPWYPVNINNIRKAFETENFEGLYNPTYIRETIIFLKKSYGLKKGNENSVDGKKNYVLIIDEINRGNISQIFGELITLIEDDKRYEAKEALTVILPYSKTEFSVPDNLYIIGTMNTADRSVEALDTALRRRFSFEPMLPDVTKITQWPEGIDLKSLLATINERLEALLTKDHTIGHAWLMNIDTLEKLQLAFKNKILPLLQEYFYNDYAKIGLILGNAFLETKRIRREIFAKFEEGQELISDYMDRAIYSLMDPMTVNVEGFKSIYE